MVSTESFLTKVNGQGHTIRKKGYVASSKEPSSNSDAYARASYTEEEE